MTTQTNAKTEKPVTVGGKVITGQQIAAFKTGAKTAGENLTVWANACTVQLYQGNANWANGLFDMPTMRLANGKLSAMGKNVLAYMKAHAPCVSFNTAKGKIVYSDNNKTKGKAFRQTGLNSPLLDADGEATTDFPLTFSEFLNWEKAKGEPKAPASLKASTVSGQVEKALTELGNGNFAATAEECAALAAQLADLMAKVATMHAKKEAQKPIEQQGVDADRAEQLQGLKPGKSGRAGGKVESAPKAVAA
jgi:hypothetical protein